MADATERFANRVENYVCYRPRYPKEILKRLELECGLGSESVIADLGSGTGFLAELFLAEYEQLRHAYGTDYAQVDHKRIDSVVLREFFGTEPIKKSFPNFQHFDFGGLKGRLLSSSYVPEAGQPRHAEMLDALKDLFD